MRIFLRLTAMLALTSLPLLLLDADVQAAPPNGDVDHRVQIGDTISVHYFESYKSNLSSDQNARTFVERLELSGKVTVGTAGTAHFPIIGYVDAAHQGIDELRSILVTRYQNTLGREPVINLKIVERDKVYVLGQGQKAGAFKYSPGMTLAHALALVGGVKDDDPSGWAFGELLRQQATLDISSFNYRLEKQKLDVLRREEEGLSLSSVPTMKSLTNHDALLETNNLIREFARQRSQKRKMRDETIDATKRKSEHLNAQLSRLVKTASDLRTILRVRRERVDRVRAGEKKGFVNNFRYMEIVDRYEEVKVRIHEVMSAQQRLRIQLDEALTKAREVDTAYRLNLIEALYNAEVKMQNAKRDAEASRRSIAGIRGRSVGFSTLMDLESVTISRRGLASGVVSTITLDTPLRPGDVVKIMPGREVPLRNLDESQRSNVIQPDRRPG